MSPLSSFPPCSMTGIGLLVFRFRCRASCYILRLPTRPSGSVVFFPSRSVHYLTPLFIIDALSYAPAPSLSPGNKCDQSYTGSFQIIQCRREKPRNQETEKPRNRYIHTRLVRTLSPMRYQHCYPNPIGGADVQPCW